MRVVLVTLAMLLLACGSAVSSRSNGVDSFGTATFSAKYALVLPDSRLDVKWTNNADSFRLDLVDSTRTISMVRSQGRGFICVNPVPLAANECLEVGAIDRLVVPSGEFIRGLSAGATVRTDLEFGGRSAICYDAPSGRDCFAEDGTPVFSNQYLARGIARLSIFGIEGDRLTTEDPERTEVAELELLSYDAGEPLRIDLPSQSVPAIITFDGP